LHPASGGGRMLSVVILHNIRRIPWKESFKAHVTVSLMDQGLS
jgi:hypothetical protein